MLKINNQINNFCEINKTKIVNFLSDIVKIKSYSNGEKELVKYITQYLCANQKSKIKNLKFNLKVIKNNIIIFFGTGTKKILYDAHIDTVPAENTQGWTFSPFSGKVSNGKIYGRGSCDDKGSVTALVFSVLCLSDLVKMNPKLLGQTRLFFSLSSNEEDSSGQGIDEVLKFVKPDYAVICEPSDLKIVYGHKGKFAIKVTFPGKPAHSSTPQLGKNAVYMSIPLIKNVAELNNKHKFSPPSGGTPLGKPTASVTYIESKTNSLNSIPYECSVYIDYRSVLGETKKTILKNIFNFRSKLTPHNEDVYNITPKSYKIDFIHRFFSAWKLNKNHNLLTSAKKTFVSCFNKKPETVLWPFCTNGSITMGEKNIPTIGFGPGKPSFAHQNNEYIEIEQVVDAIKFYSLLPTIIDITK